MFFDTFNELCKKKGVSPKAAVVEMGLSNSLATKWKKTAATPQGETLNRVADYFGVSVDHLLGKEQKEQPVTPEDDEPIIILNRGVRKLTPEQRRQLLDVAKIMFEKEFKND